VAARRIHLNCYAQLAQLSDELLVCHALKLAGLPAL
jgi:hypothetical protein